MSENNCAVYAHVNLINGKKYFGITTQNPPENRWKNGNGYINNTHFSSAVKKYGWDNFAHYVLFRNIPVAIAKNIEEFLIKSHMSYDPNFGYNKTYGGELEKHTKETRRKISENHADISGEKNPMKRPEVAAKISKAMSGEKNPMYGKHYSEDERAMQREAHLDQMKPVEAIDPESGQRVLYFKSTQDAGRAGFNRGTIWGCCNGNRKTHKKFIWRYVEEVSDDDINSGQ